jgi:D-glycero-D-manno-heptose 1,7-bisphosphate phosphatase
MDWPRAVSLDKDGTIVEDVPYNADPRAVRLLTGVATGLRRLHQTGYRLIVVSNRSGVARGYFPVEALRAVEARLRRLVDEHGIPLGGFYWCPHHPNGIVREYAVACACRKPQPGLLERAAQDLGVSLPRSWMVGDVLDDVEAGRRAGCRTILIANGHESVWRITPDRVPDHVSVDLREAAQIIVGAGNGVAPPATFTCHPEGSKPVRNGNMPCR